MCYCLVFQMDERETRNFPAALDAGLMAVGTDTYSVLMKHIQISVQRGVARVFNLYNGNELLLLSSSGWQCKQRA